MKKILAIFTEINYSRQLLSSAIEIAKESSSHIHGIFLKRISEPSGFKYPFLTDITLTHPSFYDEKTEKIDMEIIFENMRLIKDECERAGVAFHSSYRENTSLGELIDHSAFADFIMVDANTNLDEYLPSNVSLKDLLVDAHCPVFLMSENKLPVKNVILAYDGSVSSIHAIKMYSYLFPEWRELPAALISVNSGKQNELVKGEYINDWLPLHFTNLKTEIAHGDIKENLVSYIAQHEEHTIVVMGAYGRDAISRMFRQSLANIILKETKASLFITHQ